MALPGSVIQTTTTRFEVCINNMATLQIDIISDVVCPWCVIGYGRLKRAIAELQPAVDLSVTWHPFELNPDMPETGENLREHVAKKYGAKLEDSIKARAMLTEHGKDVGFNFNYFDEMKMLNTFNCHQLLHWAKDSGLQNALSEALFEHFFSNRGDFSHGALLEVVKSVGLDIEEAKSVLETNRFEADIRAIEQQWHQQGIHSVPLFIFNNKKALSGAHEIDTFKQLLSELI